MTPLQKAQARLGAARRSILRKDARQRRVRAANIRAAEDEAGREFRAAFLEKMVGTHESWAIVRRKFYTGR